MKKKKVLPSPTVAELEKELKRVRYKENYGKTLRSTLFALITVAAIAVLIATLVLPVFRIYGSSMTPSMQDGDLIVALKSSNFQQGEVIAFYYNNKILVKRVIATSGQWVDIDAQGNVSVDGVPLDEPYLEEKAFGECNIALPFQVPEGRVFVMGDHRSISIDSRNTAVGCVSEEQIVGKLILRFWPFDAFGKIE